MKPRDVLTGAVALKAGFIDLEQFRSVLQPAWAAERGAPLDRTLPLDPATRRELAQAVEEALAAAGGDPQWALIDTCLGLPERAAQLAQTCAEGTLTPQPRVVCQPRRYTLGSLLGEGGAGRVFQGRDTELSRPVAIKVLRSDEPSMRARARFLNEARVGALLEHPNVCPVYHAGRDTSGHLFMALRWVRGSSLEQVIEGLRDGKREVPFSRRAEIMIQVARGVAYAHGRGVLHRDLKPANVMLGRHGEVFVMDWGLAKIVGRDLAAAAGPSEAAASGLSSSKWGTLRDSHADMLPDLDANLTLDGHLIGTPAYMSPEQMRGENSRVDVRTEVYALGATLYELLTLSAPFAASSLPALFAAITEETLAAPRAHDARIPADLAAICSRCLEKDPADRYPSVDALLADLRSFRDGRVVAASGGGRWAHASKWARRNRTVGAVCATTLALLTAAGVGAGLWVLRERADAAVREKAAREETLARAVAEAHRASAKAWSDLQESGAATSGAPEGRATGAGRRTGRALAAFQAAERWHILSPEDESAAAARHRAALALGEIARQSEQWDLAEEAFGSAVGLGVDDAGARTRTAEVRSAREARARRRRAEILALLESAESGELATRPEGLRDAVFQLVRYPEPQTVELLVAKLDEISRELLEVERSFYLERLGDSPGLRQALAVRAKTTPGDRLPEGSGETLRLARAELAEWVAGAGSRNRVALELTGSRQQKVLGPGKLAAARIACEALGWIGIQEEAVEALGRYLRAEADASRALPAGAALVRLWAARAFRIASWACARYGPGSLFARTVQSLFDTREGRAALDPPLAGGDANAYFERGQSRIDLGMLREAINDLDKAIQIDPRHARAWLARGTVHMLSGLSEAAIVDYTRAIELAPDWSPPLMERGNAHARQGHLAEAIADLTKAIELEPTSASAWTRLGFTRMRQGELDRAIADCSRALEIDPRYAPAYFCRAIARRERGDLQGALEDLTQTLEIDPGDVRARFVRAVVRARTSGASQRVLDDLTRVLELDPKHVRAWLSRGRTKLALRDLDGALADFRRALKLDGESVEALLELANLALWRREFERALGHLNEALGLDPRNAKTLSMRGACLFKLKEYDRAIADLGLAIQLDPSNPRAFLTRARAYLRRPAPKEGDMDKGIADLTQVLSLRPNHRSAHLHRGLAKVRKGDRRGAALDYEQYLRRQQGQRQQPGQPDPQGLREFIQEELGRPSQY